MELCELSLCTVRDLIKHGDVTVEQAVSGCISRIRATEPKIMALLATRLDEALERARSMDASRPADFSRKPLWRACHCQRCLDDKRYGNDSRIEDP